MLTAIIADDEPKVCALIRQLGDWDRLGIEIKAICGDGEEALQKIREYKPNIVITDIRMPVIDGLELVDRARGICPDAISFIIISGYRHFEYAHSALQHGVASYLLKPIDKIQLNATLERICAEINKRDLEKNERTQLAVLQQEKQRLLNERFVMALLAGDVKRAADLAEALALPHTTGFAMFVNTSFTQLHDSTSIFGTMIAERAEKTFAKCGRILAAATVNGVACLLALNKETTPLQVQRSRNLLWAEICSLRDVFGDYQVSVGVGDTLPFPDAIDLSLHQACERERCKITRGWDRIVDDGGALNTPDLSAFTARLQSLASALDTLNEDAMHAWFTQWRADACERLSDDGALRLYAERDTLLRNVPQFFSPDDVKSIALPTDRARDAEDLIRLTELAFTERMRERLASMAQEESRPMRDARAYVQAHFAENLSLEAVAGEIGYNPVYFSALYKRLTGQGFTEYVTEIRITQAKELLKNSRLSILEISNAVGYLDDKYFRKLFKRITGISPKAYRKLYE